MVTFPALSSMLVTPASYLRVLGLPFTCVSAAIAQLYMRVVQGMWCSQIALSTDLILGFCGETEEDHAQTLDLLRTVGYDQAFLFAYSLREKTHAARHWQVHT